MLSDATGRIDVHSHLLPGVDDGCASLEESLDCARQMVQAGYTHSFCTPHIWPSLPDNIPTSIARRVAELQGQLDQHKIPLRLFPGGEMNMTAATATLLSQEVVTYGFRRTHLLIDLWADRLPPYFEDAIRHLQSFGIKVILAHPERMRAVQDDPDLGNYLAEMGVLLQCNLQCLGDPQHAATRIVAERWLAEDRYFMIGSDLHNSVSLPLRLRGLKRAIEAAGEEKVWQLTRDNPKQLLPKVSEYSRFRCAEHFSVRREDVPHSGTYGRMRNKMICPHRLFRHITVLAVLIPAVRAAAAQTATVHPSPTKHLVLDSRIIDHVENARLAQGVVEKDSHNPLFVADKPWENALNNLYPNIVYDADAKVFKLWYKCVLADKDVIAKMMPPATVHDVGWFLLYATSQDGVIWEKPDLGLIPFDGSTHNNIVARDTPNVGVFKDDHDADASRRYKMIFDLGMGQIQARFSPDGLHWSEKIATEGMPKTGDTHNNALWDARLGKYVLFTKQVPNHERTVFRSESDDFIKWSTPVLALHALSEEGKKRQTYCMPVYPWGDGYVGLVMMYNAGIGQTVDCELAWSPDSITWTRPFPGKPFIPRGRAGSYDAGCIYAQANPPVLQDGKMLIFYGGSTAVHKGWKRHCLPCLARLRPDGFACYEAEMVQQKAVIMTKPVSCTSESLRVSVDAEGGSVRVGVVDEAGFGVEECEPIRGNVSDAVVRWKGVKDLAALKGKTVRLRFELDHAKIYSFEGVVRS